MKFFSARLILLRSASILQLQLQLKHNSFQGFQIIDQTNQPAMRNYSAPAIFFQRIKSFLEICMDYSYCFVESFLLRFKGFGVREIKNITFLKIRLDK